MTIPVLRRLITNGYIRAAFNIAEYFMGNNTISKNTILTNNQFETIDKENFIEYDKDINSSFLAESKINSADKNDNILSYFNDIYGCALFSNDGTQNRKLFEQSLLFVNPKKKLVRYDGALPLPLRVIIPPFATDLLISS